MKDWAKVTVLTSPSRQAAFFFLLVSPHITVLISHLNMFSRVSKLQISWSSCISDVLSNKVGRIYFYRTHQVLYLLTSLTFLWTFSAVHVVDVFGVGCLAPSAAADVKCLCGESCLASQWKSPELVHAAWLLHQKSTGQTVLF